MRDRRQFLRSLAVPAVGLGLGTLSCAASSGGSERQPATPQEGAAASGSSATTGHPPRSSTFGDTTGVAQEGTRAIYDVIRFGADPGLADNQPAIQRAIDACEADGGGIVSIPPGAFRIVRPLLIPAGRDVTLRGCGPRLSTIRKTSDATLAAPKRSHRGGVVADRFDVDAILAIDHADDDFNDFGLMCDLGLEGLGQEKTAFGVYAPRLSRWSFRDVLVQRVKQAFFSHQLFVTSCSSVLCEHVGEGFVLADDGTGDGGSTSWSLAGCYVNHARRSGYRFFGLDYSTLTSCAADDINQDGTADAAAYRLDYCRGANLVGCGCEASRGQVVSFRASSGTLAGCRSINIDGISGVETAYLRWDRSTVTVIGCSFDRYRRAADGMNERMDRGSQVTYIETLRPGGGDAAISYDGGAMEKTVDERGVHIRDARGDLESFFGTRPRPRSASFSLVGAQERRRLDPHSAGVSEIADTLATLIADLQEIGILGTDADR